MEVTGAGANAHAEDFSCALIGEYFGGIAAIDEKTIRENAALACEGGFSEEDRTVRAETVDYLLREFSVIYLGLLANEDFRARISEAVKFEMDMYGMSRDYENEMRTHRGEPPAPSEHNVVIDLRTFNLSVAKNISGRIKASMDRIMPFYEEISSLMKEETDEDAAKIGYCVCNFMYLIKAFEKDPSFFEYVRSVVRAVAGGLGIA